MLKDDELDRRDQHFSPRGAPIHRQADRAGAQLRRPGRHRHREHAAAQRAARKSLEQQTATSEVLQVISSSPGELEPVFQAMLANATRICEAKFGKLYLLRRRAVSASSRLHNAPPAFAEVRRREPDRSVHRRQPASDRVVATKQVVHIATRGWTRLPRSQSDRRPASNSAALARCSSCRCSRTTS